FVLGVLVVCGGGGCFGGVVGFVVVLFCLGWFVFWVFCVGVVGGFVLFCVVLVGLCGCVVFVFLVVFVGCVGVGFWCGLWG
ncbi:hypothetical protein, partial [Klebsiella pneumoniae]|uniref:hypothetical protein n=1 Tax=Klebsiella pneumoniae TaxID=573 RepID=UPI0030138B21